MVNERIVTVEHFTDADKLASMREILEDAGLHPTVFEEAGATADGDETLDSPEHLVLALQAPESEAEEAARLLEEYATSEQEEEMELLEYWAEELE